MNLSALEAVSDALPDFGRRFVFRWILRPVRKLLHLANKYVHAWRDPVGDAYQSFCQGMELFDVDNMLSTSGAGGSGSVQQRYLATTRHQWKFFKTQPKISILLPVYKVAPRYLEEALASVALQTYPNWEVCIVDDASGDPALDTVIKKFIAAHPNQVQYTTNHTNQHISATSNECLRLASGDWCALLDHDDRLYPNALFEFVRFINLHPNAEVFFSDEIVVREDGQALGQPFFKPAWSPILNLQVNYCAHLCAYKTSLIRSIGGFRVGYEGSQDHDLITRAAESAAEPPVHIPFCVYQWRVHPQSTASSITAKPYAADNGIKAVLEACARRGLPPATATYNHQTFHYDLKFAILGSPKVSIIIPTRNNLPLLRACVESIVEKTTWRNFEILIVDNASDDAACLEWLQAQEKLHANADAPKIRVLRDENDFNFAHLNNLGSQAATGEYLILLNNDTAVISADWIEQMLQFAQIKDIGCVGARLLYEDGSIQHAGGILTGEKMGNHACKKLPASDRRYMDAIATSRECSFVTGACLMIERAKYLEIAGLDEAFVPNGFGDVDLCLRLSQRGLRHIYAANAILSHFESKTRGKSVETFERFYMMSRWSNALNLDPYLNMNLARDEFFQPDRNWPTTILRDNHFAKMIAESKFKIFEN